MSSLVSELQQLATDQRASIVELLQKCLVAAVKLGVDDLAAWARQELDGYGDAAVPPYREVGGHPVVFNPYHGYVPLVAETTELASMLSTMFFNQPIGEIEHAFVESKSGMIVMGYPQELETRLRKGIRFGLSPALQLSSSQLKKILDAVRKIVLEWSLTLENDKVVGEGMSFSEREKESAKAATFHVQNYFAGGVSNSQVQIETIASSQSQANTEVDRDALLQLIEHLERVLVDEGVDGVSFAELRADVDTLKAQARAPRPNRDIVRIALGSVRSIVEGVVTDLAKQGILQLIGRVLGGT